MLRPLLMGFAAALPALSAAAAPATPEEAARLAALFARYAVAPAPGAAPSVSVVPLGDGYRATLDFGRAFAGLQGLGVTVDPGAAAGTLTPLPDGTWRVESAEGAPVTVHVGAQSFTFRAAASRFDGIWDPDLRGFRRAHQEQAGAETVQSTPTSAWDRRAEALTLDLSGTGAASGADVRARYGLTGANGTVVLRPAAEPGAPAPAELTAGTSLSYAAPTGALDVGFDRLRTGAALDLWQFLAAHPDRGSLAAAQGELKGLLRAGLPYLDALRESGTLDALAVTTPAGVVRAKALRASVDASGLAGAGHAALALAADGLAAPAGQLPPWSAGLVPTGLDLHLTVDGFHAAEAASALVEAADLGKEVAITPEQKAAAGRVFWPGGTLVLAPSRIATAALDLRVEGRASLAERMSGSFTITGTGVDAEIAALRATAGTDPGAGSALGPLTLAKNLAKPGPDGSLVWVIEFGDAGVKVNGAPLQ